MTTNEIKTLIQNTIAGQGSQVDIGGKLAEILVSIVDAIPAAAYIDVTDLIKTTGIAELTEQQFTKFQNSAGLISNGVFYPKVTALTTEQSNALDAASGYQINGSVVPFGYFVFDDNVVDSALGLFVFLDSSGKFYVQSVDI